MNTKRIPQRISRGLGGRKPHRIRSGTLELPTLTTVTVTDISRVGCSKEHWKINNKKFMNPRATVSDSTNSSTISFADTSSTPTFIKDAPKKSSSEICALARYGTVDTSFAQEALRVMRQVASAEDGFHVPYSAAYSRVERKKGYTVSKFVRDYRTQREKTFFRVIPKFHHAI